MIKKGDFIEVSYTGNVGGDVFDTTDKATADKNGISNPNSKYENVLVCVGEGHLLKGLDTFVEGKEAGKEYHIKLLPDNAFGKKDARLIQMIPKSKFTSQNVNPQPGMQLNVDDKLATIVQASGGRILVDFNHPLAGREVEYDLKILRKIDDKKEQLNALVKMELGLGNEFFEVNISGGTGDENATITFKDESIKPIIENIKETLIDRAKKAVHLNGVVIGYKSKDSWSLNSKSAEQGLGEQKKVKLTNSKETVKA